MDTTSHYVMRVCANCRRQDITRNFPNDPKASDGKHALCHECWTHRDRECEKCRKHKPGADFPFAKQRGRQLCLKCTEREERKRDTAQQRASAEARRQVNRKENSRLRREQYSALLEDAERIQKAARGKAQRRRKKEARDYVLRATPATRVRQSERPTVATDLNLSAPDVREMRERIARQQENRCAICDREFEGSVRPALDHDHAAKVVRGVLCSTCNTGLGLFYDAPDFLDRAATYLKSHSVPQKETGRSRLSGPVE